MSAEIIPIANASRARERRQKRETYQRNRLARDAFAAFERDDLPPGWHAA